MVSDPTTPNMGLIQSKIGGDFNTWGANEQTNNSTLDTHTHQNGSGVQITPLGLNINQDLSFQGNNLNLIRALRLNLYPSVLAGPGDVNCLYAVSPGNIYWNDASGMPIQLGSSGGGGDGYSGIYPQTSAAGSFTILSSASYIEVLVNTNSLAGTITLPPANSVSAGRFFIVKDATANAATHNITVLPAGADTIDGAASLLPFVWNGQSATFVSDGNTNWGVVAGSKTTIASGETLTVNGLLNVPFGGLLDVQGGAVLTVLGTEVISSGGAFTAASGSTVNIDSFSNATAANINGTMTFGSSAEIIVPRTTTWDAAIGTGTVFVQNSGTLRVFNGGTFQVAASSNIALNPNETLNITDSIKPLSLPTGWVQDASLNNFNGVNVPGMPTVVSTSLNTTPIVFSVPVKNGATLNSVKIIWNVGYTPSGVPASRPSIQIIRLSIATGSTPVVATVGSATSMGSNSSTALFWQSGLVQATTCTCSSNNVIDTTQYSYFGVIYDNAGTNAQSGNGFYQVVSNLTVPDLRLGL